MIKKHVQKRLQEVTDYLAIATKNENVPLILLYGGLKHELEILLHLMG